MSAPTGLLTFTPEEIAHLTKDTCVALLMESLVLSYKKFDSLLLATFSLVSL